MLPEHTDLRIQRTRLLLCETLIDLIAEKGFDAIHVKDIAERAMINRATFYRHFEDKYALVTYIFKEAIAQMFDEVGPVDKNIEILTNLESVSEDLSSEKMREAIATLASFFEYFATNEKLYRSMLGKNGSPWFSAEMSNYLSVIWLHRIQHADLLKKKKAGAPALSAEMVSACLARSVVGMITWWLESGRKETAEEMATGCILFIAHGYYHALGI